MVTKKTQESREQLYVLSCIIGLVIAFVIIALICFLFWRLDVLDKKLDALKEDNTQINNWGERCWTRLRTYDPNCWDPSDCINNPKLQGCSMIDSCNHCCYGSCTLMYCSDTKFYQEWVPKDTITKVYNDTMGWIYYKDTSISLYTDSCKGLIGGPYDTCY